MVYRYSLKTVLLILYFTSIEVIFTGTEELYRVTEPDSIVLLKITAEQQNTLLFIDYYKEFLLAENELLCGGNGQMHNFILYYQISSVYCFVY